MIRGIKVKLYPNKEQEILFKKSCGLARYAYNWGLNYQKENYKNGNKYIGKGDMKKLFKHFRDENEEVEWIFDFLEAMRSCLEQGGHKQEKWKR